MPVPNATTDGPGHSSAQTSVRSSATDFLGRRRFLASASMAAASCALTSFLPKAAHAQSEPKRGGHFVFGIEGASASDSLDPVTYAGSYMPVVSLQLLNTLTEVDAHGALTPILA